jgi:hypothetical protein
MVSFRLWAARPVSWLLATRKQPAVNLVLSLVLRTLPFAFSLFFRTSFITLPMYLLWYIYRYCWDYYLLYFPPEAGLFAPAWPAPRTRLVISMVAIPAWGLSMAVGVAAWHLLKYLGGRVFGRKRRGDYALAIPMEEVSSHTSRKRTSAGQRSYIERYLAISCFAIFVAMALSGVYLFETYELPADHRYKPDIETALRIPKQSGYHNGSKRNVFEAVFPLSTVQPRSLSPPCLTITLQFSRTGSRNLPR